MLDHITLPVADFRKSRAFFGKALAALGYEVIMEFPGAAGMGPKGKPVFWFKESGAATPPIHVAFHCRERRSVDAFHEAALKAGGKDNGKPGIRAMYHPNYYGAFVLDPDGNNIEAVCHEAE